MKLSNPRLLPLVAFLLSALLAVPASAPAAPKKKNPNAPVVKVIEGGDPKWATFDRLVAEAKLSEAAGEAKRIREVAIAEKDNALWQKALVEEVRLRDRQGESSESLRLLRSEKWPATKSANLELGLLLAGTLQNYLHRYRWEIRNRELIQSKEKLPLEKMTAEQIYQELADTLQKLWAERSSWADQANDTLPSFVQRNTYPKEIRGTARDTVTYLAVSALADTSFWSPAESNETTQLSVERLLEGNGPETAGLADAAVHPLVRVSVALRDLESWHRIAGRLDAALEAKLERYRRVRAAVAESDRRVVTDALEKRLTAFKKAEWWSAGMADLANFRREEGKFREAYRIATAGFEENEGTPAGERCANVVKTLEAPTFRMATMQLDGAKKRSLLVYRQNVKKLYFRAYAMTVKSLLEERAGRWSVLPSQEMAPALLKKKPTAAWDVDFPEARDFGEHQSYVTPPIDAPGIYVIFASHEANFEAPVNIVYGTVFQISDYVLTREISSEGGVTFAVYRGATGEMVPGAKLELYNYNYDRKPFQRVGKFETAEDGRFVYTPTKSRDSVFATAEVRDGKNPPQTIMDPDVFSAEQRSREPKRENGFFFTDRAIYRPKQPLNWKLVIVRTKPGSPELSVADGRKVKVDLCDANGEVVSSQQVKTDAYGSVAGKFDLPSGRLLGSWSLRTADSIGSTSFRVEEYKRPTFEVTIAAAKEAVKLNKPASVEGEARYYFGMAVPDGQVKWRVTRQPVMPAWWGWCGFSRRGFHRGGSDLAQTVAAGIAKVDDQGKFRIQFVPKADERSADGEDTSYRFEVTADVTDPGGETRSANREYRLGAASIATTIEPSAPFFSDSGAGSLFFRRANLDGEPKKGKGTWRILALNAPAGGAVMPADVAPSRRSDMPKPTRTGREDTVDGDETLPRWTPYEGWQASLANLSDGAEVFRGSVDHGEDGRGTVALPKLQAGAYRLRYDSEDDFGKKIKTWRDILVVASKTALPVPAILEVEKASVEPGDKLRVLIATGFATQPLYFEILRDGVVQKRERVVEGDPIREIPIVDADRGGFTLALTLIRDHQLIRLTRDIYVPWTDRTLSIAFESFRDKMRPGGKETWTLRVKGPQVGGKDAVMASAQVLAYMYDRSLDAFAPHFMPSMFSLLPSHTGAPAVASPLGEVGAWSYRHNAMITIPAFPTYQPDAFERNHGYGYYDKEYRRARAEPEGAPMNAMAAAPVEKAKKSLSRNAPADEKSDDESPSVLSDTGKGGGGALREQKPQTMAQAFDGSAQPGQGAKPVEVRSNFAETGFWFPQLISGADGSVKIQFTVPDSVTAWRVMAHAFTKEVKSGQAETSSRTVKELMVRPYLPRFVREGDKLTLRVAVNNAGNKPLEGKVRLEILDADTQKSLAKEFDLGDSSKSFSVAAGKGTDVRYSIRAPVRVGPVSVKVVAQAGDLSDGELRPMPLLPSRMHLVQSRFATLRDGEKRVLRFDELAKNDDRTRIDEQMVLTLDGQLFNGVLKALPYLAKYAYECVEQTVNRFLSTSLVGATLDKHPAIARVARASAKRSTPYIAWDQLDPNRKMQLEETPWLVESRGGKVEGNEWSNLLDAANVRRERESAFEKLAKSQKSDGGFPWFAGGPASTHVTLYVLNGLSRAVESGVPVPKDMVQRAWKFVAEELRRYYLPWLRKDREGSYEHAAFVAFVATSFPDASWTEGGLTTAEVDELVDAVFNAWKRQSKYVKAYLAWTLKRRDRLADARLVFGSVLDAAKTEKDKGTFWAPEDRAWLWYNDTIESHAFLLRTTLELEPRHPKLDGMAMWLFLNRKLNHWKSTRATAEAIYALLKFVAADRTMGETERYVIEAGALKQEVTFAPDAVDTTARVVIPGDKIDPRKVAEVSFESKSRAFALASATWHFSTERLPRESSSDFFSVSRAFFRRETTPTGPVLKPLAEGAAVQVGDEIEVQLSLKTKHPAEYVHLRDPRGAGFEPEGAVSGYKWGVGAGWYEEYRDSATNFFFEQLPAGEYPFRYRIRAATAGTFRVGPATVQSMYAPEFAAYSSGTTLPVRD